MIEENERGDALKFLSYSSRGKVENAVAKNKLMAKRLISGMKISNLDF